MVKAFFLETHDVESLSARLQPHLNVPIQVGSCIFLEGPLSNGDDIFIRKIFNSQLLSDVDSGIEGRLYVPFSAVSVSQMYVNPRPRHQLSGIFGSVYRELEVSLSLATVRPEMLDEMVRYLCHLFIIPDRKKQSVTSLSGGEAERLMLALCVVSTAAAFAFDSCFSAQDRYSGRLCRVFIERYIQGTSRLGLLVESKSPHASRTVVRQNVDHFTANPLSHINQGAFVLRDGSVVGRYPAFSLYANQILVLSGPNGSGKTLLGKYLLNILPPEIQNVTNGSTKGMKIPGSRAYLPQDPIPMFWHDTVAGEIDIVSSSKPTAWSMSAARREIIRRLPLESSPFDLSVAEQKWLGAVKVFDSNARIIVLDEPTEHWTSEDVNLFVSILNVAIQGYSSIVVSTHDERLLSNLNRIASGAQCNWALDEVGLLSDGSAIQFQHKIVSSGRSLALAKLEEMWDEIQCQWASKQLEMCEVWYRRIDPCIALIVQSVTPEMKTYLDLGCGNGIQTLYTKSLIERQVNADTVSVVAVDCSPVAIAIARSITPKWIAARWVVADIRDSGNIDGDRLHSKYDVISTFFTLECVVDALRVLDTIKCKLQPNGIAIVGIVNPEWAALQLESERGCQVESLGDAEWSATSRFHGMFGPPLDVPYFHRSWRTYLALINEAGLQLTVVAAVAGEDVGAVAHSDESSVEETCEHVVFGLRHVGCEC